MSNIILALIIAITSFPTSTIADTQEEKISIKSFNPINLKRRLPAYGEPDINSDVIDISDPWYIAPYTTTSGTTGTTTTTTTTGSDSGPPGTGSGDSAG